MEHDARFWSGKGGVLIAVVSMFVLIFLCVRRICLSLGNGTRISASTTIHLAKTISIKQPAVFGNLRAM